MKINPCCTPRYSVNAGLKPGFTRKILDRMQTKPLGSLVIAVSLFFVLGCDTLYIPVTYTPRSRQKKNAHRPSIVLIDMIVEFRERYNSWPYSKEQFTSKDPRYKELFIGFPYQHTRFDVIDQDNMIFYFDQHVKDEEHYKEYQTIDLNAYRGEVKFYKENGRFLWKTRMY